MSALHAGDSFPSDVVFKRVPWTTDDPKACGLPQDYNASKEWADKKVVLVAVPGAFTPGCQGMHVPGYIEKLPELRKKGVDIVAVIAFNDAFVMSAWGKINGMKDEDILFMADTESKFSEKIGWVIPESGGRAQRYAIVVDHGKVIYAEKEAGREIKASSAETVLAKI